MDLCVHVYDLSPIGLKIVVMMNKIDNLTFVRMFYIKSNIDKILTKNKKTKSLNVLFTLILHTTLVCNWHDHRCSK